MATRQVANRNNFIRWDKINGDYTLSELESALPGFDICKLSAWQLGNAADTGAWNAVTYGDSKWVAVAGSGTNRAMTSTDGLTWTARTIDANTWNGVTFGNGVFIAVSSIGADRFASYT